MKSNGKGNVEHYTHYETFPDGSAYGDLPDGTIVLRESPVPPKQIFIAQPVSYNEPPPAPRRIKD